MNHKKPPNVLFVIASLRGGAAEHLIYLLEHCCALGMGVYLVAPDDCPATTEKINAIFRCEKNNDRAGNPGWFKVPLHKRWCPTGAAQIAEILMREKIDLLHMHGIRAGYYGRSALRKARGKGCSAKSLYTIHGFHTAHYSNPLLRRLAFWQEKRLFQKLTDGIIFVCEEDRRLFESSLRIEQAIIHRKCRVIPNAVRPLDPKSLPPKSEARRILNLPQDAFVISSLSRFNPQKAVHLLLEAGARLKTNIPEAHFILAGDGPLQCQLKSLARSLGMADKVHFLGYRNDVLNVYAATDVLALTSRWEGLPLVLLEGASLGIPMVASDIPGSRDVLTHGKTGLLFEKDQVGSLVDCLRRLHDDPPFAAQLGQEARREIPMRFSLEKMLGETVDFYRQLLNNDSSH